MDSERKTYSFFHLNIMFSSIPLSKRPEVIEKCYWPLLRLASEANYKVSIESTGLTLEIIHGLDPEWTEECKKLIQLNKLEFIGSGFSQIIAPLVPGEINRINLALGDRVYSQLLDIKPKICLVNEMAFSFDLIDIYLDAGYDSLILDINNFTGCENFPIDRPTTLCNSSGSTINVIWADSISFQQFQRYVHGLIDEHSYYSYVSRYSFSEFPIYSSDAEIFNYRPGRFKEEAVISSIDEWARITDLYSTLIQKGWKTLHLREILDSRLETIVYKENNDKVPIYVKKQDKYNINRWGLTGRFDLQLNTWCYNLYESHKKGENIDLKFLLKMWSSDYRTHLSLDRVASLKNQMNLEYHIKGETVERKLVPRNPESTEIILENGDTVINLDLRRGGSVRSLIHKGVEHLGWLPHGTFNKLDLAFDYYTLHSIIEPLGERKITSLVPVDFLQNYSTNEIVLKTNNSNYVFEKRIKLQENGFQVKKSIKVPKRRKEIIHPFIFTFTSANFELSSLYYESANGGLGRIKRKLLNDLDMTGGYSHLITSIYSLGNTDGVIKIGDAQKSIAFKADMSLAAVLPKIKFVKTSDSFLLRLIYSAQEVDDTFVVEDESYQIDTDITVTFSS